MGKGAQGNCGTVGGFDTEHDADGEQRGGLLPVR